MAYDALVESLRLISGDAVAGAERLTRRRRFLPVAVDVDDDIAATVFLRRAHGGAEWATHLLSRTRSGWQLLGGGGWGLDSLDVLTHVVTANELGGPARADGAGAVWVGKSERPPSGGRVLRYSILETTDDVHSVTVAARHSVVRPAHGYIVVVWRDKARVPVTLVGHDGQSLGNFDLRG